MRIIRHLLAILLLPFVMAVLVPRWLLARLAELDTRWSSPISMTLGHIAGGCLFLAGLLLAAWCVALFARVGRGTLAPWDPTQRLVVVGPYRHVRNPMISGVAMMLAGEALFHGSRVLSAWLLLFMALNHTYFMVVEEPGLARRFGASYEDYRRHVPRWIPRWRPYTPAPDSP